MIQYPFGILQDGVENAYCLFWCLSTTTKHHLISVIFCLFMLRRQAA